MVGNDDLQAASMVIMQITPVSMWLASMLCKQQQQSPLLEFVIAETTHPTCQGDDSKHTVFVIIVIQ